MRIILVTSPIIILLIIGAIGIIAFLGFYYNKKQIILRQLSKIPYKPIGSIKTNELTKVIGKALHVKEPLIAPYSKRKCIFYSIKIQQRVSTGKSSHWKTIVHDEKFQDFFVENKGEYVIVKPTQSPRNFYSHLEVDKKASSGTFNDPTPEFEALLQRYNIDSTNFFGFNKPLRYREGIIGIGEKIAVAGIAKWKNLSEPIPEYSYSKIAALESTDKQKLFITDHPKAVSDLNRIR